MVFDKTNKPLKVLMFGWNFPPAVGGIEYVAKHLCRGLCELGCGISVIARFGEGGANTCVIRPSTPGLLHYMSFSLLAGLRLMRNKSARPDLLVCPGIVDAPVAFFLSKLFRIPFVVLAHGSDVLHKGFLYRVAMTFLFRRAEGVCANSRATFQLLLAIGCRENHLHIINPGVCPYEAGQCDGQQLAIDTDAPGKHTPVLITVGRVIRRKGIGEFILHVLPGLIAKYPDLIYYVVGGDASESLVHRERLLEEFKKLVSGKGLGKHVCFTGQVSDEALAGFYDKADLFVLPVIPLPDDLEGFGIVLLEAALHGVPAVATRTGGIPDAVVDGETGVLVDCGDYTAIMAAIIDLLQNSAKRKAMGEQARRRAVTDFSWDVIARQYLACFETVAPRTTSSRQGLSAYENT